MSEIIFSDHARFQMNERGIAENLVRKTLELPQISFRQSDGRTRTVRRFNKKKKLYAAVVISEDARYHRKVVTAFVTSKIAKYFQKP